MVKVLVSHGHSSRQGQIARRLTALGARITYAGPQNWNKRFEIPAGVTHVILAGGGDVNPMLYGALPFYGRYVDDGRDAVEVGILCEARERRLPVLGICRGMQLMAVWSGGALHQNLVEQGVTAFDHAHNEGHEIDVADGSFLKGATGRYRATVNTYHRQAVDRRVLPRSLWRETAWSVEDNVLEAMERRDGLPWYGVQFHPESMRGDWPWFLFERFLEAA